MKKLGTLIDNLKNGLGEPTRHHNPYLKEALNLTNYLYTPKELLENNSFLFHNRSSKIIVEIGCYMGKNILELAQQNSLINFIGLDITYKRAVKAAKKIKVNNLHNAKIALCDGKNFLTNFCTPNSLDGVCVFFPDPWPKDKHEKNRLLNLEFIKLLKDTLKPKGFFWFKTDAQDYFIQTENYILENGFIADKEFDKREQKQPKEIAGGPYETAFQKIFQSKQVPYFQNVYLKL